MGRQGHLVSVIMIGFIIKGVITQGTGDSEPNIKVEILRRNVVLTCQNNKGAIVWSKDGETRPENETSLNLGTEMNDPRGVYACDDDKKSNLQLYFRKCQNCIELNAATISGIVVADVIATIFLAIAVYCITGQDSARRSQGEMGRPLHPAWGRGVSASHCRDRECLGISMNTRRKDGWSDETHCTVPLRSFHYSSHMVLSWCLELLHFMTPP
uniref:CD3 gamma/delta subunit Ig-like domain-containing protein n=1 Tax=Pelusios castaneus TaxID=367368 RepID=A0A8C8S6A3_9SAUR